MTDLLFDTPELLTIPVNGEGKSFPVGRIFCVGRNYAAHAAEMGLEVDRTAPFYFTKSATAAIMTGATIPYPPGTSNFHYEMELVVAIGKPVFKCDIAEAQRAVYAYGCGLDMTRRDLQINEREKKRPWDLGKDVENSAVLSPLTKAGEIGEIGPQKIQLEMNGELKQNAMLSDMIWKVDEIIAHLSGYYHLRPGDLIMTGTPAGVGPVVEGNMISGSIDGLDPISLTISAAG